jgi:phospholipase C
MYQYIEKVSMFKSNTLFDARRLLSAALAAVLATSALAACGGSNTPAAGDIHLIKHVVVIMQENRSFDSYFGTYPGVDGIPMQNGVPTVCAPDPRTKQCVKPFYDPNDLNHGGPHGVVDATNDINGGKMDGFIAEAEHAKKGCKDLNNPACNSAGTTDVMGYHDAREIPNYWNYAQNFVLQDHMFEPNASWSLPAHLFMVSAWSANCSRPGDQSSCQSNINRPGGTTKQQSKADYA